MAYNETVNVNINANTQDASANVEKLENNIKTLDGAINIIGGSVEVLAGGLALTGALSEEQADKFQSAAVGAIAFADGTKRILDGYKILATETKALTVVQRIYNAVMNANPIFIIVGILAAVTTGVIALTSALRSQREEQERLNQAQADEALLRFQERELRLAQLRGESEVKLAKRAAEIAKEKNDQARAAFLAARGTEEEEEAQKAYNKTWDDYIVAREKVRQAEKKAAEDEKKAREQAAKDRKKQNEEEEAAAQRAEEEADRKAKEEQDRLDAAFQAEQNYYDAVNSLLMTEEESRILNTAKMYDDLIEQAAQYGYDTTELEAARQAAIQAVIDDAAQKRQDEADKKRQEDLDKERAFRQQLTDLAVDSALGTLSALSDLNQLFDQSSEEAQKKAFRREKALGISETLVSTYAAAQKAYASQLIPGDPTSVIRAQIAAGVAIAGGLARVAVISQQKFDSPSTAGGGGNPGGSIPGSQFGAGTTTIAGATGTLQSPTLASAPPVRAYVVTGDVRDGLEAESILRTRRQFP